MNEEPRSELPATALIDTHIYGVFATPIVGLIWLWLTDVSVLLGGTLAHELGRRR